jgi:pyrimidine deaminase RibD-like protein
MTISENITNRAINKALQSQCAFKISALGFNKRGELVSVATNVSRFSRKGGGIHAEVVIMRQAKRKGIATILICRVNPSGDMLPIEPCENCSKLAKKLGIRIFSISDFIS